MLSIPFYVTQRGKHLVFQVSYKFSFSNVNNLHYILRLKSNLAVICTDSQAVNMFKSLKCISMKLERPKVYIC